MSIHKIIIALVVIINGSPALPASQRSDLERAEKYLERGRMLNEKSLYDSLPYYFMRAKAIFLPNNSTIQTAECFIGMSEYYRYINDLEMSALTLDTASRYIQRHIGLHSESWADALNMRAKLMIDHSEAEQAIDLLDQSLVLLEDLKATPEKIARTEYLLGTGYFYLGDMRKSLDIYESALESYQQKVEGPTALKGRFLHSIGLLQSRSGNLKAWKDYTYKSIANATVLFGPDHPELANYYSSLTSYFIDRAMSDSAHFYLEKSEGIVRNANIKVPRIIVLLYVQRARILRLEGNYIRALDYFQQANETLQKNQDKRGYLEYRLYRNMGSLYKSLGDYQSAEKILFNLLDLEGSVHPTNMATNYYYLADIQTLLGNYSQSEKYYKIIFNIHHQYPEIENHRKINDFLGYGALLDSLRMFEKADPYYLDAERIAEYDYGFHDLRTARIIKRLGDHFFLMGDNDRALAYYQRSIFSMAPEYDTAGMIYNPPPKQINDNLFYLSLLKSKAAVLKNLARFARDTGDRMQFMKAEFSSYQTSINIIDQLRNSYIGDRSKLYLSKNERDTYEKCVESAYGCYEISGDDDYLKQAFMVAEKGKYATLLSALQREKTIALAGIPDSIVKIDSSLRMELSIQQEILFLSQEDTLLERTAFEQSQTRIFQVRAQIESLNKRLEREYPAYYDLLYNQQVISPETLRENLRFSEKLLEYFYASNYLYRFEIYRRGMDCRRIPLGGEFDRELAIMEEFLYPDRQTDIAGISDEEFLKTANSLYHRLIPPSPDFSKLIIIPEGKLSSLPFDILVSAPVENYSGRFNRVPFLIRDFTIRYGYSATLLNRLEKGGRLRLNKLIAFAPGYGNTSGADTSDGEYREKTIDRTKLRFLPGSIHEVEEIGKMSGGRVFTGTDASEGRFKQLAGESQIIHLALHANLDNEDPLKSKLVFWEGNDEEDDLLNVYEIYNLNLAARMVVLSACNTGAGMLNQGEGIMSLARAFFYAGVQNLIMTLWTVSDIQSSELMLGFYRHLIAGRSTETALRKAKLDHLEQASPSYQHPKYWAGYILVGNPDTFFLSRLYKLSIPGSLITLFLVTGFFLVRRRFRRED